ncbi:MAG: DEAD/DEAH box helicase [Treponema sp.]|nr:DEAD/DEAH box helicase [Treponema sp.]
MNFTEFSLHEKLQQGIAGAGYVECTPVQEQVLKNSLEGRDLYVQSQTGTGKTAAYLVSIIQQMLSRQDVAGKKALVMVPTRELAVQVQEEAEKLCSATELVCSSFYGGVGYDKQVAALKKGVDIMIGTPGRVIDLHEGGQMDLSSVAFLCIDEADRMFDMGFYPDLRTLIKVLPAAEKRQTMLFSATLNSYVKNLAWEYTRNPAEITIAADNITVDEIDQELLHVSSESKMKLLTGIISSEKPESLIIFCNTKRTCEVVAKRLKINGIQADYIIGDLPQKARLRIMDDFKAGKIKCLVATDVAARGIDVNDLAMVINYDLPNEAENYVHRIGRTARAGKSGKAYTFCSEQDVYSLPPIERYIEKQIPARVAEESMLGEDKSEGMYIRTENYHEDYNDKSEFGRRRQAEYERSGRGRRSRNGEGSGRARGERGKGRYSKGNKEASREYKRDRRVFNEEEEAMLATMSMDERMKLYKEKFASTSKTAAASTKQDGGKQAAGKQAGAKGKKASGKGKKSYKDSSRKQYSAKNEYSGKNRPQGKPSSAKEASGKKRGIFGRIKSLFSKK